MLTDEYDPVMADIFRAQPAELSALEAMRGMFAQVMVRVYEQDRDLLLTRVKLVLSVPAIRGRTFDSMHHSAVGMFAELIAERTGRPRDGPKVRLFTWAVMGALQSSIFSWAESEGALDLPKLVDEALEFLAEGCPL